MNERLITAAMALLADIKSMQTTNDPDWFGEFSNYEETPNGCVILEWPNLAISFKELEDAILGIKDMEEMKQEIEIAEIEKKLVNAIRKGDKIE